MIRVITHAGLIILCTVLFVADPAAVGAEGSIQATYWGGTAREGGFLLVTAVQAPDGTVFVAGPAKSTDAPVPPTAFQPVHHGQTDVLLARFSDDLTRLLAATYLGGSAGDTIGRNIVLQCDADSNVTIAVETASDDFPVMPGGYNPNRTGGTDIAVVTLDSHLENMIAGTYLGGTAYETATNIRRLPDGAVAVGGWTRSDDFPVTPGAWDTDYNGSGSQSWGGDLFVAILDASLETLVAATFLGGQEWDYGGGLSVNASGNILVTGGSGSIDYPVTNDAWDTEHAGWDQGSGADIVVSILDPTLSNLLHSTFIGGSLDDWGYTLTAANGSVFVTGHTSSEDFPVTQGAHDGTFNGLSGMDVGDDVFIARLTEDLSALTAATYIGGTHWECGNWIDVDVSGTVYVGGQTGSLDFPVTGDTFQTAYAGGRNQWGGELFLARFDSALTLCIASTFYGGSGDDGIGTGFIGQNGSVTVCGYTTSGDLPGTASGYDPTYNAGTGPATQGDIFLMSIDPEFSGSSDPEPTATPSALWYQLNMPDTRMSAGDTFLLERDCGNPEPADLAVDEYIILDVGGYYWYWPAWSAEPDWQPWTMPAGAGCTDTIITFSWPAVNGSAENIRFWGALLNQGTANLIVYTWIDWSYV